LDFGFEEKRKFQSSNVWQKRIEDEDEDEDEQEDEQEDLTAAHEALSFSRNAG